MSEAWSGGSTRAWRRVRALVLLRDGYRCRLALPGCTVRATDAHHTLGRARTGDDPRWVIAACAPCNVRTGEPVPDPAPRPLTRW
jgi:5-methylcytosine-specific restriction endonuclease McrA